MKNYRFTPAFTMLELVFVIMILGIVASIGTEMVVKVYESYIVQRAEHRASVQTELSATQIANRLSSAIPGTVYRIRTNNTYEPIESDFPGTTGDDYKGIQWVSADTDSFSATTVPGWSGFCDVDNSTQDSLSTPGSNLSLTNTIISTLSNGKSIADAAVYFPSERFGQGISGITGNTIISLDNNVSRIVEHYKLAWTSYAIVVEGGDLFLYYNFAPTPAIPVGNIRSLLMEDVSTFKFKGAGRTIRFKICKEENIGDSTVAACKEKAVF